MAFTWSQRQDTIGACGDLGPYDFDTYEAENYIPEYNRWIEIASIGQAAPVAYTIAAGDVIDLTYQGLETGPRTNRKPADTAWRIPPTIFKSIAWIEAVWNHASSEVPYGGVGPVIRSFDCGYGLGQITTGMSNNGWSGTLPAAAKAGAGSVQVSGASGFVVGDVVSMRGPTGNPQEEATVRSVAAGVVGLETNLKSAYPTGSTAVTVNGRPSGRQAVIGAHPAFNLAEGVRILADKWNSAPQVRPIAGNGDPAALEDWYFAIWSYNGFAFKNHPLNPFLDPLRGELYHCYDSAGQGYGSFGYGDYTYPERVYGCMRYPPVKQGVRLWKSVTFVMLNLKKETGVQAVLDAFDPKNFTDCEKASFAGGCAAMDYPTTIPEKQVVTHPDPTVVDPNAGQGFLGAPSISYSGPSSATFLVTAGGQPTFATIIVRNDGTWLAPYRVRTSHPWISVRHPTDPATRTIDGGLAVGKEVTVVITSTPRKTQAGYESVLRVSIDKALYPGGLQHGKVWIEPLYGAGGSFELSITALGSGGASPNRVIIPFTSRGN